MKRKLYLLEYTYIGYTCFLGITVLDQFVVQMFKLR